MSLSSDNDFLSSILLLAARSNSKCKLDSAAVLSDDASNVIAKPRKCGHPEKVRSDSEVEEVVEKPPRQKPGPKPRPKATKGREPVKKEKAPISDSESVEVVGKEKPAPHTSIHCPVAPEATSEGSQRLAIQATILFEDVLELIHETIGCVSVVQKLTLAYKLSTANQKSATINLRSVNDWDGLVTDAIVEEGSRCTAESAGTFNLIVTTSQRDRTRCSYIQLYDMASQWNVWRASRSCIDALEQPISLGT
ncbi:hypothetical protein DFH08DRAFT_817833 [Mycena albidolilacea]|uniref:Uncharacterized protein n=1 Tax=Mycena albidolilacea TaxID=1033008 RepID=A0AAD6ZI54_9AGAR|nr:hypothetical protein DFH08DRAFT_817833 [Mycena albidolilacea]